jgi:hypothetical protein
MTNTQNIYTTKNGHRGGKELKEHKFQGVASDSRIGAIPEVQEQGATNEHR